MLTDTAAYLAVKVSCSVFVHCFFIALSFAIWMDAFGKKTIRILIVSASHLQSEETVPKSFLVVGKVLAVVSRFAKFLISIRVQVHTLRKQRWKLLHFF